MTATAFVLWVMVAGAPPYQRGEFRDYQACVAAAHGAVESLEPIEGRPVTWQCASPSSNSAADRPSAARGDSPDSAPFCSILQNVAGHKHLQNIDFQNCPGEYAIL
jgi:hypothetical protein